MSTVDEIFASVGSSSGDHNSGKRKLQPYHNPSHYYKSPKVEPGDTPGERSARVDDDTRSREDMEAGPEIPFDEGGDDEEGRFFGSGINNTTQNLIDLLDQVDGVDSARLNSVIAEETKNSQWVRRLAVSIRKKIATNTSLRTKFPDDPLKFIQSEADLDDELRNLTVLAEAPELYEEFVQADGVALLMGLLNHENPDIVLRTIEVLTQLTDDDVNASVVEWEAIVNTAVDADLIPLLRDILLRVDDTKEDASLEDAQGIETVLGLLEILSSRDELVQKIGATTGLMEWLLKRITSPEPLGTLSANKVYAAEILSILCNTDSSAHLKARLIDPLGLNAIEAVLTILSRYRKSDPPPDQEDFSGNLFSVLGSLLEAIGGKNAFLSCEGVPLVVIMLREGGPEIKRCAARTLHYALDGCGDSEIGSKIAEEVVEFGGLAGIFTLLMKATRLVFGDDSTKRHDKKSEKRNRQAGLELDAMVANTLLPTLTCMFTLLPVRSSGRIRLLAKFVEREYEKLDRLVRVYRYFNEQLSRTDSQIEKDRQRFAAVERSNGDKQEEEDERAVWELSWYQDRITGGLHGLRTVSQVLAWIAAEDQGCRDRIMQQTHLLVSTSRDEPDKGTDGWWAKVLVILCDMKGELVIEKDDDHAMVDDQDEAQLEKEGNQMDVRLKLATLEALIDVVGAWV